jgi:predicted nucleic acid-binding protein
MTLRRRAKPANPQLYYLESSALAKLYVREAGSRELARWLGDPRRGFSPDVRLYVSRLAFPETMSAVTRRRNDRLLSQQAALGLWRALAADFMGAECPYLVIDPTEAIVGRAALLVATYGVRGYDAVQLATALWVQMRLDDPTSIIFVCSDDKLRKSANAAGLATIDPQYPES